MAKGSWFKAHRKQVITHTSIVVVFVLFIIFVSEPLFDRLEAVVQGESRLHDLPLPGETGNITNYIDTFTTDGSTTVEVTGWAFIDGQDAENSEIYMVLKSHSRTYIFDTREHTRPDVTAHFKELNLNLDYSGYTALIPARKIANGEYTVGIYIRKGDVEALIYTNRAIIKSGDTIKT